MAQKKKAAVAETVVATIRMDPDVRKRMKRLALERDVKLQQAINEALLAYLSKNGY